MVGTIRLQKNSIFHKNRDITEVIPLFYSANSLLSIHFYKFLEFFMKK
nr:MAG TPA: hypothetical protein [Caudoviricetes sp.]